MCTFAINENLNGIEITFESKPSNEIRDSLKALGFRWHGQKKLWYAKKSDERMALALKLSGNSAAAPAAPAQISAPAASAPKNKYGVKVGDIFYGSFGYSMTIVEFFRVEKILSACKVEIQRIGQKVEETERGGSERVVADPENKIKDPVQKMVMKSNYDGEIYIKTEYCTVRPWAGQSVYQNTWD